jgi:hypothetical protein
MTNVVRLKPRRKSPVVVSTSPAFEEAWQAYPETGRLRSSRKESWPIWCEIAGVLGEPDLASRVKRYASEDKEHRKESGAPGFHRWLRWGRWEHWRAHEEFIPTPKPEVLFPDQGLRAAFHLRFQDERARKWFDGCELDGDTLIMASPAKQEWLTGPFRKWAVLNGVMGYRLR